MIKGRGGTGGVWRARRDSNLSRFAGVSDHAKAGEREPTGEIPIPRSGEDLSIVTSQGNWRATCKRPGATSQEK